MPSSTTSAADLLEDAFPGVGTYAWRLSDGKLEWSRELIRIYGRTTAPASEAEFMACLHPDDRIRVEGETETYLTGGAEGYLHSFRILRPDGSIGHVIDRGRIIRDAAGRVTEVHGLNLDVTDNPHLVHSLGGASRTVAAAASAASRVLPDRARLELGQRTSGVALADIDYRAGTIGLDAAAARLYGLGDRAMTVTRDALHATFHPADVGWLQPRIRVATDPETGGRLVAEHRIILPDGAVRWLQVQKRIDFETHGGRRQPDRGILAAIDVTDRRQAEIELRESEHRLALAQDVSGIGTWDADLRNGRLLWTDAIYDLLQLDRSTPVTLDLFFGMVHPDDAAEVRRAFRAAVDREAPFHSEFRMVRPDGTVRHVAGKGRVVEEEDGAAVRMIGVSYDITDRKLAEAGLRDSEARLRTILDETVAMIGVLDTDGTLREANSVALKAGGLTREDVVGRPFWEAPWWTHDPAEVARLRQAIARAAAGEAVRYDARVRFGDGSLHDIDFGLSPVAGESGQVTLLVPSALEITDRKRAEARLAEREAQLALFVEHAPAAVAMFDRDMRYIANSRRYVADYDLPEGENLIGRLHYDVFPDVPDRWREVHARVLAGETLSTEEDEFPRADGRHDWTRWTMAPWRTHGGEIGGAILFFELITGQVEARRAREASEARYRTLFESINAGFCVAEVRVDAPNGRVDYRIVEANEAFYERTGFPRSIFGRWLREAAPGLEEHWYELYGGVARTGQPVRFEEHSELLGRWFTVYAFPMDAPEDSRVGILFDDITERKQQEARLDLLLKEVNHRAKNMLSLVTVIARRTAASGNDGFLERFSDRIRALATNQDILVRSEWRTIELDALVRAQLAHFADLIDRRILLDGPFLRILPSAAEKLGMALHELSTNAAKYGALSNDAGRVRITWRVEGYDGAARFVMDWREEGGPALETPPAQAGFGTLVSGSLLATSLTGSVQAEYPADGLSWRVECPVASVTDGAQLPSPPAEGGVRRNAGDNAVLIVEDDLLIAMSLADCLRDAGLTVIGPTGSTEGALALVERTTPAFAVLDVHLGGETSERIALRLRELGVPFLCVSGYARNQLPAAFMNAPFLQKPVEEALVVDAIRAFRRKGVRSS